MIPRLLFHAALFLASVAHASPPTLCTYAAQLGAQNCWPLGTNGNARSKRGRGMRRNDP